MIFKLESDVRDWVRDGAGLDRCFWTEAARGGTDGLPDTEVVIDSLPAKIELKLGSYPRLKPSQHADTPKRLKFNLRVSQKIVIRRYAALGVPVFLMVGIEGTEEVAFDLAIRHVGEDVPSMPHFLSWNDVEYQVRRIRHWIESGHVKLKE